MSFLSNKVRARTNTRKAHGTEIPTIKDARKAAGGELGGVDGILEHRPRKPGASQPIVMELVVALWPLSPGFARVYVTKKFRSQLLPR